MAPPPKRIVELVTNGIIAFFSFAYRPGATKDQICQKMTGSEMMKPASSADFT